jgi:mature-parasite-infected erythrocyte surface antigen
MDNFKKACETFAAVSLGINDDNVKLKMWEELMKKFDNVSEDVEKSEVKIIEQEINSETEKINNIVNTEELNQTEETNIVETPDNVEEKIEDITTEDVTESTEKTPENKNNETEEVDNEISKKESDHDEKDASFEIDEDLDDISNEKKVEIIPEANENTSEDENEADEENKNDNDNFEIDDELDCFNKTEERNSASNNLNEELMKWTNNTTKFLNNSIREYPAPVGWNFVTGAVSKRAGKLRKVFDSDKVVFYKGEDLKDGSCFFIDKDASIKGYPDEFKEFLEKQHRLSTVDEAHLKLVNISNVEELGKTMKIVPFLKDYKYVEDIPPKRLKSQELPENFETDSEIWEREKKYALDYSRYYDTILSVIDRDNEYELSEEDDIYRKECEGSFEQQRISVYFSNMFDRNTIVDMLDNLIIKFPNLLSYFALITEDDKLRSKYLPDTATLFKGHPTHLFGRRDNTVPSDVADTSMATREALTLHSWLKILCYITKRAGDMVFNYLDVMNNITEY